MKKVVSVLLSAVLLVCLVGCGGEKYNFESFTGVVRLSEETAGLVLYIPAYGEVEIPESENCRSYFSGDASDAYQLKQGDLVTVWFRYEKSWDENSVKVMESHPAKFDRKAYSIEANREGLFFGKDSAGYVFSFPETEETKDAVLGDTLYFVLHGGENGRAYRKLYAEGEITERKEGSITVSLVMHGEESEFLFKYTSMSVERAWEALS